MTAANIPERNGHGNSFGPKSKGPPPVNKCPPGWDPARVAKLLPKLEKDQRHIKAMSAREAKVKGPGPDLSKPSPFLTPDEFIFVPHPLPKYRHTGNDKKDVRTLAEYLVDTAAGHSYFSRLEHKRVALARHLAFVRWWEVRVGYDYVIEDETKVRVSKLGMLTKISGENGDRSCVLYQLLYWSLANKKAKKGHRHLRCGIYRMGFYWVAKSARALAREIGLNRRTVERHIRWLRNAGFIHTIVRVFAGRPCTHFRLDFEFLKSQIDACFPEDLSDGCGDDD